MPKKIHGLSSLIEFCLTFYYCLLQEAINKLQDRCGEHEAYQENFTDCSNWINTLQRRLQVCANMAGDKDDVEDRLIKLQVGKIRDDDDSISCIIFT